MKNLLILLILGLASYGGYTAWTNHRGSSPPQKVAEAGPDPSEPPLKMDPTPAPAPTPPKTEPVQPKVEPKPAMPVAPAKRLAPEGVFYAVQAFSVTTDEGIRGIRAGTPVKLVKDSGVTLRVTDGKEEFEAKREYLTNDLDIAARAAGQQASQQAANAEWHQKQQAMAAMNEQQKGAELTSSVDAAQKTLALNNLTARQSALNLEGAKIQASITEYERVSRRPGTRYYDQYGVLRVVVGDTHTNELIALRQKLAGINAELTNIANRINQIQR